MVAKRKFFCFVFFSVPVLFCGILPIVASGLSAEVSRRDFSGEFLLVHQGARATALSGAVVSNCLDYSALYWNPSAAAFTKNPQLGFTTGSHYADIRSTYLGFIYPYRDVSFGVQTFSFDTEVDAYDKAGVKGASGYTVGNRAFNLLFSWRLSKIFSAGVGMGNAGIEMSGPNNFKLDGQAGNSNISATLKLERFSAGMCLANLGGQFRFSQWPDFPENQPQVTRLGLSYRALKNKELLLAISNEAVPGDKNASGMGIGAEYEKRVSDRTTIFLRLGIGGKSASEKYPAYALGGGSLGLGLKYQKFGFDYGVSGMGAGGMGGAFSVHRIGVSVQFGKIEGVTPSTERPAVKPSLPPGQIANIAVADLSAKNVSAADASIVADFLRTELVNTRRFNVIEKANMEKILAEAAFQQTGCTTSECAVQMGKLLNVHTMVVGSLSKLMDTYYITTNLVEVETGKIIASYDQDAMSAKELKQACRILAEKLAGMR